jgi:hypothetical protein
MLSVMLITGKESSGGAAREIRAQPAKCRSTHSEKKGGAEVRITHQRASMRFGNRQEADTTGAARE